MVLASSCTLSLFKQPAETNKAPGDAHDERDDEKATPKAQEDDLGASGSNAQRANGLSETRNAPYTCYAACPPVKTL